MVHPRVGFSAVVLVFFVTAGLGRATILTFDQVRIAGVPTPTISGNAVPQDYGDNVSGSPMAVPGGFFTYGEAGEGFTPNVAVSYFSDTGDPNLNLWNDSYGDLTNVLFGTNLGLSLHVLLTADPGFDVLLHSFDLAGWPNADYTIAGVRVLSGAATPFSQTDVLVEGDAVGPGHTSIDFGVPLSGPELEIVLDFSNLAAGSRDNIGIDNIRFGQDPPAAAVVPEPSTAWLILGAGIIWRIARRRPRSS